MNLKQNSVETQENFNPPPSRFSACFSVSAESVNTHEIVSFENVAFLIEVFPDKKKQTVIARSSVPSRDNIEGIETVLASDRLDIGDRAARLKFIEQVHEAFPLDDDQKTEIHRAMLKLSGNDRIRRNETAKETKNADPVETSFKILENGCVIEQIQKGFAVFYPENGEHSIVPEIKDADDTVYIPISDSLLQQSGGIQLADELTEYGTEAELIADIENYLLSFLDLKPLHLRLTALYILFTYMFDRVLELSYLNATGDAGSGKSRFGLAVCYASRRGLFAINPSASSIFRIVDKFQPTLFIDEFNNADTDDAAAVIQILNAGFQGVSHIPRQSGTSDGKFKTEMFNPYCPKIIGSLKQTASNAFNSRCIEIQMERSTRNDLPLRLSHKLLDYAQRIRNKLTLWRIRNIQNDFEAKLDRAELELKQLGIMPRSIQINIPLFALIDDGELKQDFISMLLARDNVLVSEKQNTFDGELIKAVYDILFDSVEENGKLKVFWKIAEPADGKVCEHIRTEKLTSMLNAKREGKDVLNERYVGKKLASFGFHSKQIKIRDHEYLNKSAMIFDAHRLAVVFRNYGLPVPEEFSLDQLEQKNKTNNHNGLNRSNENIAAVGLNSSLEQVKPNIFNTNGDCSNESKENSANRPNPFIDEVF